MPRLARHPPASILTPADHVPAAHELPVTSAASGPRITPAYYFHLPRHAPLLCLFRLNPFDFAGFGKPLERRDCALARDEIILNLCAGVAESPGLPLIIRSILRIAEFHDLDWAEPALPHSLGTLLSFMSNLSLGLRSMNCASASTFSLFAMTISFAGNAGCWG